MLEATKYDPLTTICTTEITPLLGAFPAQKKRQLRVHYYAQQTKDPYAFFRNQLLRRAEEHVLITRLLWSDPDARTWSNCCNWITVPVEVALALELDELIIVELLTRQYHSLVRCARDQSVSIWSSR